MTANASSTFEFTLLGQIGQFDGAMKQATNLQNQVVEAADRVQRRGSGAFAIYSKGASRAGVAAQQFGFQVNDLAVQLAAGQPFLLAFSQQASQFAGVFGGAGAAIGAAIGILGGLGLAVQGAVQATNEAEGSFEDLAGSAGSVDSAMSAVTDTIEDQINALARLGTQSSTTARQLISDSTAVFEARRNILRLDLFEQAAQNTQAQAAIRSRREELVAIPTRDQIEQAVRGEESISPELTISPDSAAQQKIIDREIAAAERRAELSREISRLEAERVVRQDQIRRGNELLAKSQEEIRNEIVATQREESASRGRVDSGSLRAGVDAIEQRIAALKLERDQVGKNAEEVGRLQIAYDVANEKRNLLLEAQAAGSEGGSTITDEEFAKIEQVTRELEEQALSTLRAKVANDELEDARKRASSAAAARTRLDGAFKQEVERAEQSIRGLELEAAAFFMSAEAINARRIEADKAALADRLLQRATADGRALQEGELELITQITNQYGALATRVSETNLQYAEFRERQEEWNREVEEGQRNLEDLANRFTNAVASADSFAEALKNIGLQLANLLAQGIGGAGPLGGIIPDLLGSVLPGLFGSGFSVGGTFANGSFSAAGTAPALTFNADGNAFQNGRVIPFAKGGVVTSPTSFPMAGGQTGIMGEAGAEAILPLTRGPGGRLGVDASGAGGTTVNFSVNVAGDISEKNMALVKAEIAKSMSQMARAVPGIAANGASRNPGLRKAFN